MQRPVNEDQEHHLDHEREDLDMSYGDVSGRDWDENTYLHGLNISLPHQLSLEPGPSRVSRRPEACAIFQTAAQETDSNGSEDEGEATQDHTYVCFEPDVASDSADSDTGIHSGLQDERLHPAEEAQDLQEQRELDNLGTYLFMIVWAPHCLNVLHRVRHILAIGKG